MADLSFDCKVVHIPHAQNYVLKMVALEFIVTAKTPKWYMYHPHRITPTQLSLNALSLYATIVTLAALPFECKVVHIHVPPPRRNSVGWYMYHFGVSEVKPYFNHPIS